jgi:hypothetical protein
MKRLAKRLPFLALALALLAQAPPAAPPATPPAKTSLAVYPIKPAGVTADLTAAMTALLTARLTPSPRLKVIEEAMLKTVMERQAMNISDACDDTSCQVEIGKLVKAQKMVTGTLSKIGSKYFLSTNLVDIQTGAAEFSTEDKCSCSEDQLEDLIAAAVAKIRNHFGESLTIPPLPVSTIFSSPATPGGLLPQAASIANYAKRPASPEVIESFFNFLKADNLPKVQEMLNGYEGLVNARDENDACRKYKDDIQKINAQPMECNGRTPLHYVVDKGNKQLAELLISQGATIDAKATISNWTPLYFAAVKGDKEMMELLVSHGASAKAISQYNITILHSAASGGNKEVVELLIAHGAEVNAKVDHIIFFDQSYFTPLHYAAQGGHKEVVEVLLAHGADVTAKSVKGKTPLKLAEEAGHQDIVDLLRQYMKKK